MNIRISLEELFKNWKSEQSNDKDYLVKRIFKNNLQTHTNYLISDFISQDSFTLDGIICDECWNKSPKKVLFIMRESNGQINWFKPVESNNKKYPVLIDNKNGRDTFFLKENYDSKVCVSIKRILSLIMQDITSDKQLSLKNAAYMNLNKRGGFYTLSNAPSGVKENFREYSIKYADFIIKEIEILSPDIICLMGIENYVAPSLIHKISNLEKETRLYKYHPSAHKSDFEKIRTFI